MGLEAKRKRAAIAARFQFLPQKIRVRDLPQIGGPPAQIIWREIWLFRQKLNTHGRGHVDGGIFRFEFLPRIQAFAVVTKADAALGAFR